MQSRSTIKALTSSSSRAVEKAMFDELQEKEELSVRVLAAALTNALYQYDMQTIYGLISAVKEQPDVLHVYVYDSTGRIIHDGSKKLLLYDKVLEDEVSKKAVAARQLIAQTEGDTLYVAMPITLQNELLGGVKVAFSLKGIRADIAKHKDDLGDQYKRVGQRDLFGITIMAFGFSILGVISAIFLARSWSQPISLLSALTARIGRGEYNVDIPIKRSDEIGKLAASFRDMVRNLKDLRKKEQGQAEELREAYLQLKRTNEDFVREISERNRAEEQVQRQHQRIQALHEINQAITSTLDLRTVLDVLLEKIDLLLPYSIATVRLFNKENGLLEPVACRNLDEKEWKAERWRGGRGLANVVFETRTPMMIGNAQTDPRVQDPEFYRKHELVSYLGVPLIAKGEVLGALNFYTKKEHEFSNEEVEFLTTLAGQAAIAIQNSQLYEQTKNQALELEKANKGKNEFLSVMSHELRTPLNVIMGYTAMIKEGMLGEISPEQQKALAKVLNRSRDLLRMITEILQATSIEAEAVKVESHEVSLRDFLNELRSAYDIPLDKELSLIWDYPSELPALKTDHGKLTQILQNLINNAIKFTDRGNVAISARYIPEHKAVEFKVADTGIGIEKEMLPSIFDMFRQVDSSETRAYGGVGIGLYIVKKFADLLGGKIDAESEPGKGSTFTVTIPC